MLLHDLLHNEMIPDACADHFPSEVHLKSEFFFVSSPRTTEAKQE
jgi:hypothetical protein